MKNLIIFIWLSGSFMVLKAQSSHNGELTLGARNVVSLFSEGKFDRIGMGMGGQFRIRLNDKINTEWFLDYITTDYNLKVNRNDYHIGWSVMYYPLDVNKQLVPYVLAGHCFDYTNVSTYGYTGYAEKANRLSSAVQMGIGTHFYITEQLDFSTTAQYMIHMGSDIHVEESPTLKVQERSGMDLEGHILISFNINYKLMKLWSKD